VAHILAIVRARVGRLLARRHLEPAAARYLTNHRGHLMVLRPQEHEVCTADLIRTLTFTATARAARAPP
jgi:hypothetical protein